jgi:cellulose synthase/poly-beta-1,6-N-acetylglucosamine synthase-like glycosyltransferase
MLLLLIQALTVLCCFFLLMQALGLFALYQVPEPQTKALPSSPLPTVSLMVAARNEEETIERCIKGLVELDYPRDKLEILVANDHSGDNTGPILDRLSQQFPHITVFHLTPDILPHLKGKARVLAFLGNMARHDFFFITDADTLVNPQWINTLLSHFDSNVGLVSGFTLVESPRHNASLSYFQSLDWQYFLGVINALSYLNTPLTAVGNNMAVSRQAYRDTGGYASIPFSITEDFALFDAVRKKGYATKNIISPGATNRSLPLQTVEELLHQRKRWLTGAQDLGLAWKVGLVVFGSYFVAFIPLLFLHPPAAIGVWLAHFGFQSLSLIRINVLTQERNTSLWNLLLYEVYLHLLMPVFGLFYLIPVKVRWKGRPY